MKAVTFQGKEAMEAKKVDDPQIQESTDMIVRITASGICGSDLHLCPLITASQSVRKFGSVQVTGVYGTEANNFPLGNFFTRNVSLKTGQAPVINIMPKLYEMIENNAFDPTDIITHRVSLDEAAKAYDIFNKKEDGSIKIIFKP
ncbi:hypothetical protein GCM10028868_16890 [Virgibacillus kimchii]